MIPHGTHYYLRYGERQYVCDLQRIADGLTAIPGVTKTVADHCGVKSREAAERAYRHLRDTQPARVKNLHLIEIVVTRLPLPL